MNEEAELIDQVEDDAVEGGEISEDDIKSLLTKEKEAREKAEKRAKEESDRRAKAEEELHQARGTAYSAQTQQYQHAIEAADTQISSKESEIERAEADLEKWYAEGNAKEIARTQSKLSRLHVELNSVQGQKGYLVMEKERVEKAPPQQDPFTRAERDWISRHPEFGSDPRFQSKVAAIASYAQQVKGYSRDSQEYIDYIDQEMGFKKPPAPARVQEEEMVDDTPPSPRRTVAADAMPVARRSSTPGAPRTNEIRLTADEREAADVVLPHIKDPAERYKSYAKYRDQMKKEGRL